MPKLTEEDLQSLRDEIAQMTALYQWLNKRISQEKDREEIEMNDVEMNDVYRKALKGIIALDAEMRSNIINHGTTKEKVGVHYFWRAVGLAKDALNEPKLKSNRRKLK